MNGYHRILAAMRGQRPDKIPIMLHNFMMAAREASVSMARYRGDAKAIASCFIQAVETYRYDGILVDVDTALLADAVGAPVDYPEDQPARCEGVLLQTLEDTESLPAVQIRNHPRVQVVLEAVSRLREYFGDEILIRGNCDQAPFSLASMLRGPENWMMDLIDAEPERLHALLAYCAGITKQLITLMRDAGAHVTSNGDSPAGPDLISPEMYRTYALPYERQVVAHSHELGLPYILHICGDAGPILADMVRTGVDGVELDYKADATLAHDALRDKVTFFGNIDPSGVLAMGTPELVRERTLSLLEIFSDTPRFVLNAGCAIPASTPARNLHMMIRTARDFR